MLEALERHPASACRSTTRARCSTGCAPSGRSSSPGCATLVARDQVEILGGGYYEPVLASLPERDRIGQLQPDGRRARGACSGGGRGGAWLAERVWEPDLPTSLVAAGYAWTILDDAHFRAAAIPEEDLWGPYTTEDQGQLLTRLRHRAGASLPDPVPGRRGRHRLPARPRDRGRDAGRDDGRRRREVRRLADDLGALLGRGPLGGAVLRGARGERRLAVDDDAVGLARRPPPDRARLRADRLVRRDGRMGAARRREPRVLGASSTRPRPRTGRRRAGCAARSGATSRSSTARSTTSTSRCCGRRPRSTRCPIRARTGWRPSITCTAASRTTATGTACSAASTSATCGWRRYEHLIAAEDLADTAARTAPCRRDPSTSTWTGSDDVRLAGPGQVVTVDLDRGRRDRQLGHPGRPARPGRGHAPPPRGLPRDAPRARGGAGRGGRAGRRAGRRGRRAPASIHDIVLIKERGPVRPAPLRRLRAPLRPRPLPRARHRPGDLGERDAPRARRRHRRRLRGRASSSSTGLAIRRDGTVRRPDADDPARSG